MSLWNALRNLLTPARPAADLHVSWPPPDIGNPDRSQAVLRGTEVDILARYNAEVAQGIQHTPDWQQRMADLQRRFDGAPDMPQEPPQ